MPRALKKFLRCFYKGKLPALLSEDKFRYCKSMTSISIPSSVTSIGNGAFTGWTSLIEIYCYATTPPEIGGQKINKETKLYVPKGTYEAYYLSKWGNYFTNIIEKGE